MTTEKRSSAFVKAGAIEQILISGVNHLDKKIAELDALVKSSSLKNNRGKTHNTWVRYGFELLIIFNVVQVIIIYMIVNN